MTVNVNGDDQPFEVFLNVGKAGSDVAAVSEAVGRLISLILRLPSPLGTVERLKQVIDQLAGIGGGRALGFGAKRVRSLPDAVAQVLREHLRADTSPTQRKKTTTSRLSRREGQLRRRSAARRAANATRRASGRATCPAHHRPADRRPLSRLRPGDLHPDRGMPQVLRVRV